VNEQWVNRGIRFAFLSPEIVQAVLAGAQPPDLTAESVLRGGQLEMDWERQKQQLGVRSAVQYLKASAPERRPLKPTVKTANRDIRALGHQKQAAVAFSGGAQPPE
jgi:hypothetical protein